MVLNNTDRDRIIYPCLKPSATIFARQCSLLRLLIAILVGFTLVVSASGDDAAQARRRATHGTFGTYAGEPRLRTGHMDAQKLLADLTDLKANTYHYLIWHAKTDWDDLHAFLPLAREKHIKVWVTVLPPTESPPMYGDTYSEPFRLDFKRWAVEIAKLSLEEPNLVAWSLDDFSTDATSAHTFTAQQWREILSTARAINPMLAFVPCWYAQHLDAKVAAEYRDLVDGVLFPYMHASKGINFTDTDTVELEVQQLKKVFGKDMPVFIDVYCSRYVGYNDTTPDYVERVMRAGRKSADGVLIYTHPDKRKAAAKYGVVKKLFHEWADRPSWN
jgi:hypothetical protein